MQKILTVYVSPEGEDTNTGSRVRPVATLAEAVARTRVAPAGTRRRILLGDGEYHATAVVLEAIDSGLDILAVRGATPVCYGGLAVTGWQREGGDSPFWYADVPGVREGTRDFRMLVINKRYAVRARFPEQGAIRHASVFPVRWMSSTKGGWERKPTDAELTTLRLEPDSLPASLSVRNAELTLYHAWDESLVGLSDWDRETGCMTFSTPAGHPPGAFGDWKEQARSFVVWNTREGMTCPGQWYLDREAGRVVYWPLACERGEALQVFAPVTESVLRLAGSPEAPVRDIRIKGVTFGITGTPLLAGGFGALRFAGAIEGAYAHGLRLEDVTVRWSGGQGIRVLNSDGLRCQHCTVHDSGAGGIVLSGTDGRVTQTLIHHIGLAYASALGLRFHGERWHVHHNTLHHTPYSAMNAGGRLLRIEHNRFHHIMETLIDGAAIYVFAAKSSLLRGNYTYAVRDEQVHAYYLDEQSEDSRVEGNVAVGVPWPIHNHMAWNCSVRGNVCLHAGDMRLSFMNCDGFALARNVFVCSGALHVQSSYTGMRRLDGNVFHSATGTHDWTFTDRLPSLEQNAVPVPVLPRVRDSVIADPGCRCEDGRVYYTDAVLAKRFRLPVPDVSGAGCGRD